MWILTGSPYFDADQKNEEEERWLERRPVCAECGEHIQEDYAYRIGDDLYCNDCIECAKVRID